MVGIFPELVFYFELNLLQLLDHDMEFLNGHWCRFYFKESNTVVEFELLKKSKEAAFQKILPATQCAYNDLLPASFFSPGMFKTDF